MPHNPPHLPVHPARFLPSAVTKRWPAQRCTSPIDGTAQEGQTISARSSIEVRPRPPRACRWPAHESGFKIGHAHTDFTQLLPFPNNPTFDRLAPFFDFFQLREMIYNTSFLISVHVRGARPPPVPHL
jgi:hypothetical protein